MAKVLSEEERLALEKLASKFKLNERWEEKGIEEGIKKVARNLLEGGMEKALVAKYTKLTLEEIEAMKNE